MTSLSRSMLEQLFKNALRYDQRSSPFSDDFAQFSVGFRANRALGLGFVHPRAVLSTYEITEPTLELWICERGEWLPIVRQNIDSWPWLAQECGEIALSDGVLSVGTSHVFLDSRTLLSRFEFHFESAVDAEIEVAFIGTVQGDTRRYMAPYFDQALPPARETFVRAEAVPSTIVGGLRNVDSESEAGLPWSVFRIVAATQGMEPWIGLQPIWSQNVPDKTVQEQALIEQSCCYALRSAAPRVLQPGQPLVFEFQIQVLSGNAPSPHRFEWPPIIEVDSESAITRAKDRFFESLNPSTLPKTGRAALDFSVARARLGLLRDGVRGLDGEFGPYIASLCTADSSDFSSSFFWDSLFSSVAIGAFHPEYARGAIATAFVRQSAFDGSTPERKWNYTVPGLMFQQAPQSPIASWAVSELLSRHRDPEFLQFIYPKLVRNYRFWERHSDMDGDGLAEYRWSGQIADNSPLWDPYLSTPDKITGCGWLPPVASVPLNCFLYKDAAHLELLARAVGSHADADYFVVRQQQIHRALLENCYLPEENRFWDYNQLTRTHRRIKTFFMFWPLYARLPMSEKSARDLIENVLLDPAQFFGAVPFPSVAYDESSYNPSGYWRGRAWPHITYWLLETLVAYGYSMEANQAALRILTWFAANGIRENLCTDPRDVHPHGFVDYNWGCAAYELIASRHYLRAQPVKFVSQGL